MMGIEKEERVGRVVEKKSRWPSNVFWRQREEEPTVKWFSACFSFSDPQLGGQGEKVRWPTNGRGLGQCQRMTLLPGSCHVWMESWLLFCENPLGRQVSRSQDAQPVTLNGDCGGRRGMSSFLIPQKQT